MILLIILLVSINAELLNIIDYGATPDNSSAHVANSAALAKIFSVAKPGDTVFIPNSTFHITGGIQVRYMHDVTIRLDGTLNVNPSRDVWPMAPTKKKRFMDIFRFINCTNLIVTSTGTGLIDGNGKPWWNAEIANKLGADRPFMLNFQNNSGLLIENIHLLNAPKYHIATTNCDNVEIRYVEILVERKVQRAMRPHILWEPTGSESGLETMLQPEDLNTDGIDVRGRNFYIHNVRIENDDDSVAVKGNDGSVHYFPCTSNVLIENSTLIGFGASIGSIPPSSSVNCVQNVTFRNIHMPETGKGIYIKSNPMCGQNKTGYIHDITYQNMTIIKPRWWAIWIGPQQQHQPHGGSSDDGKCALFYPMKGTCPTQGCVDFVNITLRDIYIEEPVLSPGVILGNSSNPIRNLVWDNVHVKKGPIPESIYPYKFAFHCENAETHVTNSHPSPQC